MRIKDSIVIYKFTYFSFEYQVVTGILNLKFILSLLKKQNKIYYTLQGTPTSTCKYRARIDKPFRASFLHSTILNSAMRVRGIRSVLSYF